MNAIFVIDKNWKQERCLSAGEWISMAVQWNIIHHEKEMSCPTEKAWNHLKCI